MQWNGVQMNEPILHDYIANVFDRFIQDSFTSSICLALDSSKEQTIDHVIWIVKGVIELTSCRYNHRLIAH